MSSCSFYTLCALTCYLSFYPLYFHVVMHFMLSYVTHSAGQLSLYLCRNQISFISSSGRCCRGVPLQIALLCSILERLDRSHAFADLFTLNQSRFLHSRHHSKMYPIFPRLRPLTLLFHAALLSREYPLTHSTTATRPISHSPLVANTRIMPTPNAHEHFFVVLTPTSIPTLR